jgi:putative hemolysin
MKMKKINEEKRWILMITRLIIAVIIFIFILAIIFISKKNTPTQNKPSGIANPASVYCEKNGGVLEIRSDEQGNQYGVCLKNEKECEEWKFYRGECVL